MIYNRYIPGTNGVYQCQQISVPTPKETKSEHAPHCNEDKKKPVNESLKSGIDLGDVLLLCIVILLLLESDGDDILSIIITIAAFLFIPS